MKAQTTRLQLHPDAPVANTTLLELAPWHLVVDLAGAGKPKYAVALFDSVPMAVQHVQDFLEEHTKGRAGIYWLAAETRTDGKGVLQGHIVLHGKGNESEFPMFVITP